MRLGVAALAVSLVVLGASACGGSARMSKAGYESKLSSAMQRMDNRITAAYRPLLPSLEKPVAPTTCSKWTGPVVCTPASRTIPAATRHRVVAQVRAAVGDAAETLAALEPPANVAADNRKLVTGLETWLGPYLANLSVLGLGSPTSVKALQKSSSASRAFIVAAKDLEHHGYKLTGSFAFRFAVRPKVGKGPEPKPVRPRPFAIVSRAGTQSATDLHADTQSCQSTGTGVACSSIGVFEESPGPLPTALAVVRPGERIRFALPPGTVPVLPQNPASLTVNDLCNPRVPWVVDTFLDHPSWAARLKPGAYILRLSFSWQGALGEVNENGIVGLLVSRSGRIAELPKPRCA